MVMKMASDLLIARLRPSNMKSRSPGACIACGTGSTHGTAAKRQMHTCTHLRKGGEIRAHRRNGRVETVARADSGRGVAQHTQHTRAASLPHGFRESQLTGVQEPLAPVCEVVSSMDAQTSAHPWMTRPNTPSPLHVGQDHPTHPALVRYQHMPDEQRAPLRLPSAVPFQV